MILNKFCICLPLLAILYSPINSKQIRGVKPELQPLYQDKDTFTCFDKSNKFPADHVNDDYCDCKDGSDEPGTSACDNGSFTCLNEGDLPKLIKSSFVNDGICDCCDGSDEYDSGTVCVNNCIEIGEERKMAENADKLQWEAGHLIYQQYKTSAFEKLNDAKNELETLKNQQVELEAEKQKLEEIKTRLEIPETFAKNEHQKAWDEHLESKRLAEELVTSKLLFLKLDVDKDGLLTLDEIRTRKELDIDASGDVTVDEAKIYMVEADSMNFEEFHSKMFSSIKTVIQDDVVEVEPMANDDIQEEKVKEEEVDASETTTEPMVEEKPHKILKHRYTERGEETYEEDEEEDLDDTLDPSTPDDEEKENNDEENTEANTESNDINIEQNEEVMTAYSESTQLLIDEADKARKNYNENDEKLTSSRDLITNLESKIKEDYGPDNIYYELRDSCFDLVDREYKYTLCPFDKAEQQPVNGGGSTSLGTWGNWSGPEENLYSQMLYSKGLKCWNGPERSSSIKITCASENKIIKVAEPNKCEYEFTITSPAACGSYSQNNKHDEL